MAKETIQVKGMSCSHCVSAVEGSVGKLQGIDQVKVNLDQGMVDVEYEDKQVTRDKIIETIEEQGYDVVF
ncbi:copper chaperone CopZ [Salsuginibacillus kocurii]|uniref:copper chaperone CopZ n=1 Tax=Salsuginibacillus kocurii TaxID=427078 RepID=UPI000367A6F2|nr:copper chaperone CopZ [Salsuginibacillus kocurii]